MILRPFRGDDAKEIVKWVSNEEELYQWSAEHIGRFPFSDEDILNYYKKQSRDYPETVYLTACDDNRVPIGHLFISAGYDDAKHPRMRFIIMSPSVRGRGIGAEMVRMANRYAFEYLAVEDIALAAMDDNTGALRCYEKAGYKKTGEVKEREFKGSTHLCIEMQCKKDDYIR